MTRGDAVAIVFREVRFVSGPGGWDDSVAAGETIVWMCVAFSLLLADIVLQFQDFRRARPAISKAQFGD